MVLLDDVANGCCVSSFLKFVIFLLLTILKITFCNQSNKKERKKKKDVTIGSVNYVDSCGLE